MIETIFTRPLTISNSSEAINSALFFKSEASTFSSASLIIEFIQLCFRALFAYCILLKTGSLLSVFSEAAFLSFTCFSSDSQSCVVGF